MAETVLAFNKQNTILDTVEKFYDSPSQGAGTVILAFTATNNGTSSASYKAYIYDATGAVVQAVIPQKIVVRDRFDLGASAISQLIPAGGSLRMESSAANSIAFYVTGDEKT